MECYKYKFHDLLNEAYAIQCDDDDSVCPFFCAACYTGYPNRSVQLRIGGNIIRALWSPQKTAQFVTFSQINPREGDPGRKTEEGAEEAMEIKPGASNQFEV